MKNTKTSKSTKKSAFYKTVLRTLLLENEIIAPARLRQILKPYIRMLS